MIKKIKDALESLRDWYEDRANWVHVDSHWRRPKGYKKHD